MIKVVSPSAFDFDQPVMSLMHVHSKGVDRSWLQKSAAVLTKEMSELKPEKDVTFVHVIALGDQEAYGVNRNGDGFPKSANEKHHHTFVKHAKWFHNHKNKPHLGHPDYGFVKLSAYNPDMHRVELVVGIDEKKDPDSIQKLASGQDIPVSMACRVPWDECTICKNHARKPDEYCVHIKEAVTQFTNDGRQIGMINYEPDFFDISKVRRNADRIAFSLRKVAGVEDVVLGTELARQWGITGPDDLVKDAKLRSRIDLLRKLAAMEKEIDGEIKADPNMQSIADSIQDLPENCGTVPQEQLGGLLREFANARVSLPLEDFLKLVMGDRYGEVESDVPSARAALPCVFSEALDNPEEFVSGTGNYEPIDKCVPNPLKRVVESIARTGSLDAGPVGGKVQITVLRKNASSRIKAPVTEAGKRLAEEYAKYKFAFVEHVQDPFVVKMSILQNFGN